MSLHRVRLLTLLIVALLPSAALAEDRDIVNYTFEDDLVAATDHSPHQELLLVRAHDARESLVRVREHFIPELYKSVDDL